MNPNTLRIAAASIAVLTLVGTANAALVCGLVQMRYYGIHDNNFRLARHWARALPHTSAHPGAVVVQSRNGRDSAGRQGGHVSRIVQMRGNCRALVSDSRGTYERDICSRLIAYVDPNGNRAMAKAEPEQARPTRHFSAKSKHYRYAKRQVQTAFVPVDRLLMH